MRPLQTYDIKLSWLALRGPEAEEFVELILLFKIIILLSSIFISLVVASNLIFLISLTWDSYFNVNRSVLRYLSKSRKGIRSEEP